MFSVDNLWCMNFHFTADIEDAREGCISEINPGPLGEGTIDWDTQEESLRVFIVILLMNT